MAEYKQARRKGRVTGVLGEDDLLLVAFGGTDSISQPFSFLIELAAQNKTKVPFDKVLGHKMTIHLAQPDGSEHAFNGLCVRLSQAGRDQDFTLYRAELVPEAWLLSKKTQSRIFQHLAVPHILKLVLKGFPVRWELRGRYDLRDYCVQYRESDLAPRPRVATVHPR